MIVLDRVLCIHYLMQFQKYKEVIRVLINSGSKINVITLVYVSKLRLMVQKTDMKTQKIDSLLLEIYKIVIAAFQVLNKLGKARFFQETFLLTNTRMEVILEIHLLIFSNTDI